MDDKTKDEFISIFNQGFEEIVQPQLEGIREDMATIREDMATKTDIDRLERKIDTILDKDMEQDKRLDRIESIPIIAHEISSKK